MENYSPSFTQRDFFYILFSKKYVFISIFMIIMSIVIFVCFFFPPVYSSYATILVKPSYDVPIVIGQDIRRSINPVTMEYINNEVSLIKSHQVLRKTVVDLDLHLGIPPTKIVPLIIYKTKNIIKNILISFNMSEIRDPIEKAVYSLKENVRIEAQALSSIITIRYSGQYPKKNADIVNMLGENYINKHISVYQESEGESFLENQRQIFKEKLEETEKKLTEYRKQHDIVNTDSQIESNLAVLEILQTKLQELENEISANNNRINHIKQLLSVIKENDDNLVLDKELREIPGLIEYQTALVALRIELGKATPRFPKESVMIKDLEEQIRNLKKSMKLESSAMIEGDIIDLRTLGIRKDEIQKQIYQLKEVNQILIENSNTITQLERDIEIAEKNYLLYNEKTEESRIQGEKNRQKVVNVSIASPAVAAAIPDFPRKRLFLVVAMVLGTLAGMSGCFVAHYLDHTLKTPQEVYHNTGLTVLGAIDLKT